MIHSFDCFDTLIGRKCGTAADLFNIMAKALNDPKFPDQRRAAERWFQKDGREYSLEDIYVKYGELFGGDSNYLYEMEWRLEKDNVFAIKRVAGWLKERDIIVSDMYLREDQIRTLLKKAGIDFSGQIVVSNYGKLHGTVWGPIKRNIIGHYGDNPVTDNQSASKAGIHYNDVRTGMTSYEKKLMEYSPQLAWYVRFLRLSQIVNEKNERLNLLQLSINVPLLRAACDPLYDFVKSQHIKKLLFMSRDGYLFHKMWQKVHPEIDSMYLYTSRDALQSNDEIYFQYLNEHYVKDTCLVDLAASFGSVKIALPKIKHDLPKVWSLVYLPDFGVDLRGIKTSYVTTNRLSRINNTHLEMLNYALHWHVKTVRYRATGWDAVMDQANEYDMDLVKGYHDAFNMAVEDVPLQTVTRDSGKLIKYLLESMDQEGPFLRRLFPIHLVMERARKVRLEKERLT